MGKIALPPEANVPPSKDDVPAVAAGVIATGIMDQVDPTTGRRNVIPVIMVTMYAPNGKRMGVGVNVPGNVHAQVTAIIDMVNNLLQKQELSTQPVTMMCECGKDELKVKVETGGPGMVGLHFTCSCGIEFTKDVAPIFKMDKICTACGHTWIAAEPPCPKCRSKKTGEA